MSNWYLLRNGQTHGPYPEEQVREWVRAGQVAAEEKLNREGDPNWLSLDMVPEFVKDRVGAPPFVGGGPGVYSPRDKTLAGVLALLFGWLGIHHFYLGNTTIGIIYLVISLCSGTSLGWVFGIIDGIIYLTKPEDQFQRNYRNWFCSGL
jgi:TM2 domain-containing membrane protein YozV